MTLKAILFDFDDTLGNRDAYAYDCYRAIIEANTDIQDPLYLEAIVQNCMVWDQHGDVNKQYIREMLQSTYGISLPYEDFNTYWDSVLWQYCVPYQDSEQTLEELSRRYTLGIITNGPSDGQRKKLERSGLGRFFTEDRITVSGDYPFKKPDPRLFQEGCRKLGVRPEEAVYVGDLFYRDVLGSANAGMTPVWIWYNGDRKHHYDCITISKISELTNYF